MRLDAQRLATIADAVGQLNKRFDNYVIERKVNSLTQRFDNYVTRRQDAADWRKQWVLDIEYGDETGDEKHFSSRAEAEAYVSRMKKTRGVLKFKIHPPEVYESVSERQKQSIKKLERGDAEGEKWWASCLGRGGKKLCQELGPFDSREEALKAGWVAKPQARSISTGCGSTGGYSDIQNQSMFNRGDAGVFEAAKHARDKAGKFAKGVGAAIKKGAKTVAGTMTDPIGSKTGEQKFNKFRRQKTFGNKARGIGSAATNVVSAVGLPLGAWIPASRPNYKKEEKKPAAPKSRPGDIWPGVSGSDLRRQLSKDKARFGGAARIAQQTMRGK